MPSGCGRATRRPSRRSARGENPRYLPGIAIDAGIARRPTSAQALDGADCVLAVTPAQALRAVLAGAQATIRRRRSAGALRQGHRARHRHAALGDRRRNPARTIRSRRCPARASPPTWRKGLPTAVVVAARDEALAADACRSASRPNSFRCYSTDDLIGVEIGGALKNVFAIAAGAVTGAGLGASAQAAMVTRGFVELRRIGAAFGARAGNADGPFRPRRPAAHLLFGAVAQFRLWAGARTRRAACRPAAGRRRGDGGDRRAHRRASAASTRRSSPPSPRSWTARSPSTRRSSALMSRPLSSRSRIASSFEQEEHRTCCLPSSARTSPDICSCGSTRAPTMSPSSNGLNAEGTLKFAGPFLDDDGKPNGSLVVIEAADKAAAAAIAADDPYAKAGLFETVEIRPWNWVFNKPAAAEPRARSERRMNYWLFKSEPSIFSFEMLKAKGKAGTQWDGVRNYAARNNMRAMQIGDLGFFYHSNEGLDIVGIAEVCALAHPDTTTDDRALGMRRHPRGARTCRSRRRSTRSRPTRSSPRWRWSRSAAFGAAGDAGRMEGSLPHGRARPGALNDAAADADAGRRRTLHPRQHGADRRRRMCRRSGCILPTRRMISGSGPRRNWPKSACRRPSGPSPGPAARGWRATFSTIPRPCAASACSISPPARAWSPSPRPRPARRIGARRRHRSVLRGGDRASMPRPTASTLDFTGADLIGDDDGWDVVLAGDVFYDQRLRRPPDALVLGAGGARRDGPRSAIPAAPICRRQRLEPLAVTRCR